MIFRISSTQRLKGELLAKKQCPDAWACFSIKREPAQQLQPRLVIDGANCVNTDMINLMNPNRQLEIGETPACPVPTAPWHASARQSPP